MRGGSSGGEGARVRAGQPAEGAADMRRGLELWAKLPSWDVLGAWNAVTRELLTITNTTVVNTETMCALLRLVAARALVGPVTLVLDNARYQRNALVMGLAHSWGSNYCSCRTTRRS